MFRLKISKEAGLTLVEIMIVMAVIAIIATIAAPNFLRARVDAQETIACATVYAIYTDEVSYRAVNPQFATLAQLGNAPPPYIGPALAAGAKQGYTFAATPNTSVTFYVTAVHTAGLAHSFYIDEDGVLCKSNEVGAAAVSAYYDGPGCPPGYMETE